jgi:hypothetical protein
MQEWASEQGKERNLQYAETYRLMILKEEKPEEQAERQEQPEYAEAEL